LESGTEDRKSTTKADSKLAILFGENEIELKEPKTK